MRYQRPAETWTEALPIGNGRLGGMVFGGPLADLIQLNEETMWGRSQTDPNNPAAAAALDSVRNAVFAGRLSDAQEIAAADMLGTPAQFPPYEPLGDLRITGIGPLDYTSYTRDLDLGTGIVTTDFLLDGVRQRREYFASAVDQLIAVRYSSESTLPKLRFDLSSPNVSKVRIAGSPPPMPGQAGDIASIIDTTASGDPSDHVLLMSGTIGGGGVDYVVGASILVDGAPMIATHHWDERAPHVMYSLGGGRTLTVLVAAETTYSGSSARTARDRVIERLASAERKGFDQVRCEHIADYRSLHDRFSLSLHDTDEPVDDTVVIHELIAHARSGGQDVRRLVEVYVDYCRYLLIASSRPGGLPSNLQGIWNAERWPNWESDFHPNINLQMNYWAADGLALPEVVEPVADWLESLEAAGRVTARRTYGAGGWVLNHLSNAWAYTAPGAGAFGVWPMGAAWMCMSLYDHYLHTLDSGFLRERLYPLMKGAAEFFLDFLVEAPAGTEHAGYLVTVPSTSPENSFHAPDGTEAYMTYGSTMDLSIIEDLFAGTLEAIAVLQKEDAAIDVEFAQSVAAAKRRLLPTRVSPTTGGIQEWAQDYREVDPGHRHVSALYGLFPGRSVDTTRTPDLASAALTTIDRKFASNYQAEGWGLGWIATLLARLGSGDRALAALTRIYAELSFPNLFVESSMYPQVGDMQGTPTAVLQMLAFSEPASVVILPALPSAWPDGRVDGMRLRGNRVLTASWRGGRLVAARIDHSDGDEFAVRVATGGKHSIIRETSVVRIELTPATTDTA